MVERRTLELTDEQQQIPGRKTDVRDCEWHPAGTRDLLRHGLLQASFIPDQAQRALRELTR